VSTSVHTYIFRFEDSLEVTSNNSDKTEPYERSSPHVVDFCACCAAR
jgi:hypothetical protein